MKTNILIGFLLVSFLTYSQTTSLFNDYHKLSFQFGLSRYTGSETTALPNTLTYKLNNFSSPHFGFYYDILQTKKFNFKVGISALLIREIVEFRIDANEIPNVNEDFGYTIEYITDGSWRFNLPIVTEYLINTSFGKISVNGGAIIGCNQEFGETETEYHIKAPQNQEFTTLNSIYSRSSSPWYANAQFGVGMYFPFEKWMLRTNVYYNVALQDLYNSEFTFSNLAQSPDTSGNFSFRGDSFGMELSIYLKKKKKD
ncbi:hypothetical protein [Winogradskyella pacifica]|uniref:hypothetical protein n=1 Tax=Winogradskyella pacifica TaxID=664642 RepID=UPI0015C87444|nr:hypothetical protein [Winogradskyella pacifica]